jgi:hypothetical protein
MQSKLKQTEAPIPESLESLHKAASAYAVAVRKQDVDDDGEVLADTIREIEHEFSMACFALTEADFRVCDPTPLTVKMLIEMVGQTELENQGLYSHVAEADLEFGGWYASLGGLKRQLEAGDMETAKKLVDALLADGCAIDHDRCRDKRLAALDARLAQLEQEVTEDDQLRESLSDILKATANALHGGRLKNGSWSWHDLMTLAHGQRTALKAAAHALRSYQYGNDSPALAKECADHCEKLLNADAERLETAS